MLLISDAALLLCDHTTGIVQHAPSQRWVTIEGRPLLVQPDPVGWTITGCPNYGAGLTACLATLQVTDGHSSLLRVDGRAVCLDSVTGRTNGSPGVFNYKVKNAGQRFVGSDA
jgi:hypothetical protein